MDNPFGTTPYSNLAFFFSRTPSPAPTQIISLIYLKGIFIVPSGGERLDIPFAVMCFQEVCHTASLESSFAYAICPGQLHIRQNQTFLWVQAAGDSVYTEFSEWLTGMNRMKVMSFPLTFVFSV